MAVRHSVAPDGRLDGVAAWSVTSRIVMPAEDPVVSQSKENTVVPIKKIYNRLNIGLF
ncbi:MAG TPA: hypothetical protein VE223_04535 [Nitrososphaeraceae archaeon]|nr:hypothetical protein [Nitrososphaeraceae archaeon]